jgi:DNA-binding transcriptional regulator LsrR (DeoR family)
VKLFARGIQNFMDNKFDYTEQNRIIAKILNLHYIENCSQAEIAEQLGLSAAKVNRLLKTARRAGMVEINIRLPFPNLFDLEKRLTAISHLNDVIVTPSVVNSPDSDLSTLAEAAASYLVGQLRNNDRICIGGGRTMSEIFSRMTPQKIGGIQVYPVMGGVQRDNDRDINLLAQRLAQKLGGEALQLFAPAFAETEAERNTFFGLTHVTKALEQARSARVGIFGIGSLQINASIIQFFSLPYRTLSDLVEKRDGVGEILGYIIDKDGRECVPELSYLIVGLSLDEIRKFPVRIGAAAGAAKAPAIAAAIRGNYFTSLVLDESAAKQVLAIMEPQPAP